VELLRIATAGSVDDGKSTLIGRLLYDSKSVFEDDLAAIERASSQRGDDQVDLAMLTDGLRAEREQGITIDVAHRYFATPRRKFIVADTPGHVQHTRNMVTGCSTADLVLILVDARNGITEQSRRHASIASLLHLSHMVVCINKMDLVGYDQRRYEEIRAEFEEFASRLEIADVTCIPISALNGDNVVERSSEMPWYEGASLLHHLEEVHVAGDRDLDDLRLPVQWVVRPRSAEWHDFRGYAGTVAGGILSAGDEVTVLPGGHHTTVEALESADGPVEKAFPLMSVVVRLADDLDIARGDMICGAGTNPTVAQEVAAMVCWMDESPLRAGARLHLKHTSRWTRAIVDRVEYLLDVNTLGRIGGVTGLELNDIGRVDLRLGAPLFFDDYRRNRATGSFILVDEATSLTVGGGMIIGPAA
jgi:bifunctional enzyme CysN/CysC